MKNLALTIALFLAAVFTMTVSAQELAIDKEVHDYGTVVKGADGSCFFTITNTGTEPLTITRAKGSCGCTVPDWPREAIAPGKSAKMKVTYDTKRPGRINKSVTITSNAKNTPTKVVRIKGNVTVPAPAPAN
ncbi:DUF1573 domain-containing protein [Flavobacteriales bacterium]|nr:DUF1573 domain-containing protein [Flavobacteriales bacterium]